MDALGKIKTDLAQRYGAKVCTFCGATQIDAVRARSTVYPGYTFPVNGGNPSGFTGHKRRSSRPDCSPFTEEHSTALPPFRRSLLKAVIPATSLSHRFFSLLQSIAHHGRFVKEQTADPGSMKSVSRLHLTLSNMTSSKRRKSKSRFVKWPFFLS